VHAEAFSVTSLELMPESELQDAIERVRQLVDWLGERSERRAAMSGLLAGMEDELARRMAARGGDCGGASKGRRPGGGARLA
jgi:hypothetical protein